jgi:hypothetical protein
MISIWNNSKDLYDAEQKLIKSFAEDGEGIFLGRAAWSFRGASRENQRARSTH